MLIDLSFATVTRSAQATQVAFGTPVAVADLLGVLVHDRHFLLGLLVVEHDTAFLRADRENRMRERPPLEAGLFALTEADLTELLLSEHGPEKDHVCVDLVSCAVPVLCSECQSPCPTGC